MDFNDVNIKGANFTSDYDSTTQDGDNTTFQNAIYDENTTYNGVTFTEIYESF